MLSVEEKHKIEEEFRKYPLKSAACIEALKIIQENRKWVSDDAVKDVAEILEMTPSEVDSVATFYNLIFRRPVGRHVILFCDSISCYVMGSENIREYLFDKLKIGFGETTPDDRFTLLPIACLGDCDHAPVMLIDNDLFQNLTREKVDAIIDNYK
jgi:NADH-quinone oxidoreductase subunit E